MIEGAVLDALERAGVTVHAIIAAVKADNEIELEKREQRRVAARLRQQARRKKLKEIKEASHEHCVTSRDIPSPPPPPSLSPLTLSPITTPSTPSPDRSLRSLGDFEAFWRAYPRKTGKGAARKAFENATRKGVTLDQLIAAVGLIRADDLQFVPHASTWLNQERWNDEHPSGGANVNGPGRSRAFQDDSLSLTKAADRLQERFEREGITSFPPRPSLLPERVEADIFLLQAGRGSKS